MVCVTGRVQGVGFRAWTRREAERHGVAGWVRNEPDGSVRSLIEGPNDAVQTMLERLGEGPPGAAVAQVATEPAEDSRLTDFRVLG